MRIILVSDWYSPDLGGVARHTENLGRALIAKGHQVLIVAPGLHMTAERGLEYELDTQRFPAFLSPYHADIFRIAPMPYRRMLKLFQQWKPDVVHVQTPLTLGNAALRAARKNHIPSVFTYHIFIYHSKGKWWRGGDLLYWKYWHHLFNLASATTVPSQSTIDYLHQDYGKLDLVCLPNGIDLALYGQRALTRDQAKQKLGLEGKTVFFYAGRLSSEKRLEDAIRGLNKVEDPNLVYIVAGDGPLKDQLAELVKELDEKRVKFVGQLSRDQVISYYQATDGNLFPSPIENHSISMLEALSFGIIILGANAGGIGGTVTDGQDGILFDPKNPAAVSEAIKKFLSLTHEQRTAIEKAAQHTAQQFGYATVVEKYLDLYRKLISK